MPSTSSQVGGGVPEVVSRTPGPVQQRCAGPDARVIGTVLPNPAFMNNKTITIYIPRVTRVAEQQLDPMEELEIVTIPVEKVERMLKEGGELGTAMGMVALMWWQMAR